MKLNTEKFVQIGSFGIPQGLKGEIKINILTSSFESFKKLNKYFYEDKKSILIFKSLRKIGKKYVGSIENCEDRNKALEFKGKKIFSSRENFPTIKNNEYYVVDLISCNVFNIKKFLLGSIVDIKNFGAGDLIEISNNNKSFYIPMNDDNLIDVDIESKIVIVNPIPGLID